MSDSSFLKDVFHVDIPDPVLNDLASRCDMSPLRFINGKSSDSWSPTDTFFITTSGEASVPLKMFMKSFLLRNDISDLENALLWERMFYYMLTKTIYTGGRSRNVLPLISTSIACSRGQFEKFLTKDLVKPEESNKAKDLINAFNRNITWILSGADSRPSVSNTAAQFSDELKRWIEDNVNIDSVRGLGFIATHQVSNDLHEIPLHPKYPLTKPNKVIFTLSDYLGEMFQIASRERSKAASQMVHLDIIKTLFQVMYTLHIFSSEAKFNHNDLHHKNILMDRLYPGECPIHRYILPKTDVDVYVATIAIPRIFDFDRSTTDEKPNESLDPELSRDGQPRTFTPRRDFVKILCYIFHSINRWIHVPIVREIQTSLALLTMPNPFSEISFIGYSDDVKSSIHTHLTATFSSEDIIQQCLFTKSESDSRLNNEKDLTVFVAESRDIVYRFMHTLRKLPEQVHLREGHEKTMHSYAVHTSGASKDTSVRASTKPMDIDITTPLSLSRKSGNGLRSKFQRSSNHTPKNMSVASQTYHTIGNTPLAMSM
jgi:hypothetical protein